MKRNAHWYGVEGKIDDFEKHKKSKRRICFWNITGTKSIKIEKWEEIKEMDIVGLVETWETKKERWKKELKDLEWRSSEAKKENKRGRAKGEIVLAIRENKEWKIVKWIQETSELIGAVIKRRNENR